VLQLDRQHRLLLQATVFFLNKILHSVDSVLQHLSACGTFHGFGEHRGETS
jgi:hypothetical protein